MLTYSIIAFSFALSSLFFIHRKCVKESTFSYDLAYVIIATLLFPILFITWVINPEMFIKGYGNTIRDKMK